MAETYRRGVMQGGTVVLSEPVSLSDGTEVLITPVTGKPGTREALLAAINDSRRVPAAWVDELERLIAAGNKTGQRKRRCADKS